LLPSSSRIRLVVHLLETYHGREDAVAWRAEHLREKVGGVVQGPHALDGQSSFPEFVL
jgi:hypothetical protein